MAKGIQQGVQAPTASYLSLSQTEAAGRPGCCSYRGIPRAESTPSTGKRGAEEPSAPALSALTSSRSVAD
eukprot:4311790-Pleurochrysis_carterae.AAC.1